MAERDNQRQRLYNAEDVLEGLRVSTAARKFLVDTQPISGSYNLKCPTTGAVQDYLDALTAKAWFRRRWAYRKITYVPGRGSHGGWGHITVSQEHRRSEAIILHEVAHCLEPLGRGGSHGPHFAGILLTLVRYQMGVEYARMLRASYRQYRVRTAPVVQTYTARAKAAHQINAAKTP